MANLKRYALGLQHADERIGDSTIYTNRESLPHWDGDREDHEADTRDSGDKGDGGGERYIIHMFFNDRNTVPVRARLANNTNRSVRAKTTLLSTFGIRRARYRSSLRLWLRISIRTDRFEACLARISEDCNEQKDNKRVEQESLLWSGVLHESGEA